MMKTDKRNLPIGWRWVKLGDVAEYINGMAFKPDDWGNAGLPIIRIQNLNSPTAPFNYYDGKVDERYIVHNGDLLISWSASLDAYIWQRGEAILNQHIFKVRENSSIVTRDYLFFAVREAMAEIRGKVHGATMQHITRPEFVAIEILLPSLDEQRRIVAILNEQLAAVERACVAAEAQLKAAEALPAAYLREVFEGEEALGWPVVSLGRIATLLPAKSISTFGDADVLAITTACLTESGFNPSGVKRARMMARDAIESEVSVGEILIARSNTPDLVGRVAMFMGEPKGAVASDLTIRVKPTDDVDPGFLTAYLSYLYLSGHWKERAGGASGTMKKITRGQIQNEVVPFLPLLEQQRIAGRLKEQMASVERTCRALNAQLGGISHLPAALLRQAFNGEL